MSSSNVNFILFLVLFGFDILVPCSADEKALKLKILGNDETTKEYISSSAQAFNCCITLENEITDLKIRLALLQQQVNATEKVVMKNIDEISGLHEDVDEVKAETLENSLRIGQTDDDITEIHAILQKLNGKDSALEQEIVDLGAELHAADNEIKENIDSIINQLDEIQEMPLGSIISWVFKPDTESEHTEALPPGWVRCNGDIIPSPSPWAGSKTPNLNGERRFLRGGSDDQALVVEEDSLQDHTHIDSGHSHTDSGHTHSYIDKYRCHEKDPDNYCNENGYWGGSDSPDTNGDRFDGSHDGVTASGTSSIQSSSSNIAGVSENYRISSETKPRNMNVVWIMRVW